MQSLLRKSLTLATAALLLNAFALPASAAEEKKAANPCAPAKAGNPCDTKAKKKKKAANPCDAKAGNPCAPKAKNPCAAK